MDKVLFENKFCRDKNCIKEVFFTWLFKGKTMLILYILSAMFSISTILAIALGAEDMRDALYPLIALTFYVVFKFFLYLSAVNSTVKADKELSGEDGVDCVVSVTEEGITSSALNSSNSVSFSNVRRSFLTKNYIVTFTKAGLIYILKRDSFTTGDTDSFVAFLKEKGVKVKGKTN